MNEWISVKDRLPDDGLEFYLVLADLPWLVGKYIDIAVYNAYNMYGRDDFNPWYHREEGINYEGITHWMPLPKLPAHDRKPPVSDDMRDHLRAYIAGAEDY